MSETTIAALAAEARIHFARHTRTDGSKFWGWYHNVGKAPEWIENMARDAHGDMMPDDYRYAFVVESLDAIIEGEFELSADALDSIETAGDIYTHDLLKWLASRNDRAEYCDQYASDFDFGASTMARIEGGQSIERREVLESVIASLEKEVEARILAAAYDAGVCALCGAEVGAKGPTFLDGDAEYCSEVCRDSSRAEKGAK